MALEHETDSPLARAVRAAGSQSAFGRLIGRAQSTVNDWLRGNVPMPAEEAILVDEAKIGVTKEELRPDLFKPVGPVTHRDSPEFGTRHHFTTAAERAR